MLKRTLILLVIGVFVSVGSVAFGLSLGTNITIYDNRSGTYNNSGGGGWWTNTNEDQEVEPGMVYTQPWDLEGFFLNGTTLTVVGGFNFKDGYGTNPDTGQRFRSGDIFIDVNGDASYGTGASSANAYGYDYVLDLDFSTMKYSVYALDGTETLESVYYGQNVEDSNPWRYDSGGESVDGWSNKDLAFYSGLSDSDVGGLLGGAHYAFVVDLGFLGDDINNFIAHFTIECGNDNLMGAVPEPSTILLLGLGLLGLGLGTRRRKS